MTDTLDCPQFCESPSPERRRAGLPLRPTWGDIHPVPMDPTGGTGSKTLPVTFHGPNSPCISTLISYNPNGLNRGVLVDVADNLYESKTRVNETNSKRVYRSVAISILLVLCVGGIDYATGFEINLSILYLIPVAVLAWHANLSLALLFAVISACEGLLVDFWSGHTYSNPLIPYWNALVWFGVFALFVLLLHRLRDALETERRLARFDHLTGVLNARAFHEILEVEIQRSSRYHDPLTLAYLDCDNFKPINDRYGHAVGDQVLRVLAQTIRNNLRRSDRIARVGGDEFVVLLTDISFASARRVLDKLRDRVGQAMDERGWPVTLSVGAVTYDQPECDAPTMLKEADRLMYESKRSGKDQVRHVHQQAVRNTGQPCST